MSKPERYTITAALPYANGPIHLGHLAGVYIPADIYARYLRLKGEDTLFICGSDEHGAAITLRAKREGISPQEIVDKYHNLNKESFEKLGITFDIYHRTSAQIHHKTAQDFFLQLNDNNAFIKNTSQQYYDEDNQQFLADRYITGECPKCQNPSAYGDQCERCGSALSPNDLINPVSTLSGKKPVLKETSHWYLPMDQHEDWIRDWIKNGTLDGQPHHDPSEWRKHVLGQCMSWIDGGLKPRAMTRDLDWGVAVPLEDAEGKVLYVWLDAPIGYISASKQWALDQNDPSGWEPYWTNKSTKLVHFLAKDNIVFHCIIFPILLKAHGNFILPDNVPANEFLNLEGDKLSTSRNWAVWLHEFLEDFPGKEDVLRYVLCSIAPETKDSEFTWKDFQDRNNNELVGILGNFVNRAVVLTHKYFDGKIPVSGVSSPEDLEVLKQVEGTYGLIEGQLDDYHFRGGLAEAMNAARIGNKYLADHEPWKLIKTDEQRAKEVITTALLICEHLSVLLSPFLPNTCFKIRQILNLSNNGNWKGHSFLKEGHQLNKPELLFEKIEDEKIEEQIFKLKGSDKNNKHKPMKDLINFDDFTKLDIRVGTILEASKHQNADKLLVLKVDTGLDQRTVVSGIAEHYQPEDLIGKKVSVLLNLAPRKIRGIESQGMILMAEDESGLAFVSPEKEVDNGGEIR